MIPSVILGVVTRVVLPTVAAFSLFLLLSGHNQPGGGFVGGLVAGAGLVLVWATGGATAVARIVPLRGTAVLALGLLVAQLTAAAGWLLGGSFLQAGKADVHLPVFGEVHLSTLLVFDTGVFVVVVGLVVTVLTTLGAEEPGAPPRSRALPPDIPAARPADGREEDRS